MKKFLTLLAAAAFASATALAATPKAAEDFNGTVDSTAAPAPKVNKAHHAKAGKHAKAAKHAKARHAKAKKIAYKKSGKHGKKKARTHHH